MVLYPTQDEMNLNELLKSNPWKDLYYDVAQSPSNGIGWCCKSDQNALNEACRCKRKKIQRKDRLCMIPNPVPWAGRWNSNELLPRLVILSLNPGSGYDNDNNAGCSLSKGGLSDLEFNRLINRNLNGETGMGEHIFSTEVFSRSGYIPKRRKDGKKVSYWVEKLYPLYKESIDDPMTKEQLYQKIQTNVVNAGNDKQLCQAKDFFDSILTVELFPYHTNSANQIGALFKKDGTLIYPSSQFNVELVRYMISKNVTVVVARSWKLWEQALGNDIEKCLRLNSPQNTVISRSNLKAIAGNEWDNLVKKLRENLNLP